MNHETETRWHRLRMTIVISQIAPTVLLITTIALLQFGLANATLATRLATAGILLASGILGALVQFTASQEARALALDSAPTTASERGMVKAAAWMWVAQYVTPTVFVAIYAALMAALFFGI